MNRLSLLVGALGIAAGVRVAAQNGPPNQQSVAAAAPAASAVGRMTYGYEEFKSPTVDWWTATTGVQFALVQGCGGGGGGAANGTNHPHYQRGTPGTGGGGGGGAGEFISTVVGPLMPGRYRVIVGAGGKGDKPTPTNNKFGTMAFVSGAEMTGKSTVLEVQSAEGQWRPLITFRGGAAGNRTTSVRTREGYGEVPTPARPTGGDAYGGGSGQAGAASIYNDGGASTGIQSRPSNVGTQTCHSGGGGASSLGVGGAGGKCAFDTANESGADGGTCAGGGGAGQGASWRNGGRGGDGFLRIIPLVDATVLDRHVADLLRRLEDVGKASSGIPTAASSPAR